MPAKSNIKPLVTSLKMETYSVNRFIQDILIKEVGKLIDNGFNLFSFVIIGQGIETLGSLFDDKPFDQPRLSKKRFLKGMSLFDSKYKGLENVLYSDLRCGLAHQLRPKNNITLATSKDKEQQKHIHLQVGEKSKFFFLIVDVFYADFVQACTLVVKKIEDENNNEIDKNKKIKNILFSGKTTFKIDSKTGALTELEKK